MPVWLKQKVFQKDLLRKALLKFDSDFDWKNRLLFTEHHLSHAASAFFASAFDEAAAPELRAPVLLNQLLVLLTS